MNPVTVKPPPPAFSLSERLSIADNVKVSEDTTNMSDLENDILEMEAKIDAIVDNLKSMNDHINLDSHPKKSNFWSTASVWTKKLQKWRRNKPKKKPLVGKNDVVQSELADYGMGRRSCDTGPRFSLDTGRVSFDEPRGSWDGYLIGRSYPKLGDGEPGGSTQTREYYLNSCSRRKKGLERSNSMVVDSQNSVSIAKVSPGSVNYDYGYNRRLRFHSIGGEKELDGLMKKPRWWNWKVKIWGNQSGKNCGLDKKLSRSNSCEFVSEKDSDHANKGLLRFYLTPLRGSQRTSTGTGTGKGNSKSMLL